jgi:hypothetical protein
MGRMSSTFIVLIVISTLNVLLLWTIIGVFEA